MLIWGRANLPRPRSATADVFARVGVAHIASIVEGVVERANAAFSVCGVWPALVPSFEIVVQKPRGTSGVRNCRLSFVHAFYRVRGGEKVCTHYLVGYKDVDAGARCGRDIALPQARCLLDHTAFDLRTGQLKIDR